MFVGCQESQAAAGGSSSVDRTDGLGDARVLHAEIPYRVLLYFGGKN